MYGREVDLCCLGRGARGLNDIPCNYVYLADVVMLYGRHCHPLSAEQCRRGVPRIWHHNRSPLRLQMLVKCWSCSA